jgi:hypothetical protein
MKKIIISLTIITAMFCGTTYAGNPDRIGEAGHRAGVAHLPLVFQVLKPCDLMLQDW